MTLDTDQREKTDAGKFWDFMVAASVVLLLFGSLMQPPGVSLNPGAFGIPVVLLGVLGAYLRRPSVVPSSWILSLAIVGFVWVSGYLRPPQTEYGIEKLDKFVSLTLFTMVAASIFYNRRRISLLAFLWTLMGLFLAALTVLAPSAANGRESAFESNPVWIARLFSSSIVIVAWLVATKKLRPSMGLLFAGVLMAGLYASGSRGPVIAAMAGVVVVFVVAAPSGRWAGRGFTLALLMPVVLTFLLMIPAFATSRIGAFITGNSVDLERTQLWSGAMEVIRSNPFGVGLGGWADAAGEPRHLWPHNIFLEVTSEMGWLAGLALTVLVFGTGARLFRKYRMDLAGRLVLALLVTEVIHVSTSGDLNARTFFFVLVLGASLAWRGQYAADDSASVEASRDESDVPSVRGSASSPA